MTVRTVKVFSWRSNICLVDHWPLGGTVTEWDPDIETMEPETAEACCVGSLGRLPRSGWPFVCDAV